MNEVVFGRECGDEPGGGALDEVEVGFFGVGFFVVGVRFGAGEVAFSDDVDVAAGLFVRFRFTGLVDGDDAEYVCFGRCGQFGAGVVFGVKAPELAGFGVEGVVAVRGGGPVLGGFGPGDGDRLGVVLAHVDMFEVFGAGLGVGPEDARPVAGNRVAEVRHFALRPGVAAERRVRDGLDGRAFFDDVDEMQLGGARVVKVAPEQTRLLEYGAVPMD